MDEEEELLYREMNREDPYYMGDTDTSDEPYEPYEPYIPNTSSYMQDWTTDDRKFSSYPKRDRIFAICVWTVMAIIAIAFITMIIIANCK